MISEAVKAGRSITIAAVQTGSIAFDLDASLEKLETLTRRAAGDGANLVVFPEAFLSGYPRGLTFGTTVGSRTPEGRDWFARCWESSVDVPGPVTAALVELATETAATLVVGVVERSGGTLYCTALTVEPTQGLVAKHRKLMPTAAERVIWGQGDGTTMPVADTPVGRIGTAICWESYMPLYRTWLYSQGTEIYVAPTADARDEWIASMRHVALEGRCIVVSCNQYTTEDDYPADYPPRSDDATVFTTRGGSCIIGPLGRIIAGPSYGQEDIVTATVDLRAITEAKLDFDPVGHYSRPDVFTLRTNPPQQPDH
jgi:nitrilase